MNKLRRSHCTVPGHGTDCLVARETEGEQKGYDRPRQKRFDRMEESEQRTQPPMQETFTLLVKKPISDKALRWPGKIALILRSNHLGCKDIFILNEDGSLFVGPSAIPRARAAEIVSGGSLVVGTEYFPAHAVTSLPGAAQVRLNGIGRWSARM